jgi:flagellar hook assembly protein FlgD
LSADHHAIITLEVYDVLGQKVRTLVNEPKRTGNYEVTWDGKNDSGEKVASGMYFYKLSAGEFSETKKMVLLR